MRSVSRWRASRCRSSSPRRRVRHRALPCHGLARVRDARSAAPGRAATRRRVLRGSALPYCPPELRELRGRRRPPRPRRAHRAPRRPPLPHDVVRRHGLRPRDGARGARPRLRVPRDLRPHAERARRPGPRAPRSFGARARRSRRRTSELAPFRVLRGVECDIRRDGTLDVDRDVLAELEWVQLSLHAGQRASRGELTQHRHRGDARSGGQRARAIRGPHPQPSARERTRPGRGLRASRTRPASPSR